MKILIDNGHGNNTPGKRSPDSRLLEWHYTRKVTDAVVRQLKREGYDAELLVPEVYDVKLLERVHRVNVQFQSLGRDSVLLVSVHCNAAGNGEQWQNATGWECWTSPGKTPSDRLADHLYDAAERLLPQPIRENRKVKGERDKEAKFTILTETLCPAVLTENLFMDSRADVAYLLTYEGFRNIVQLHVEGIIHYLAEKNHD